jgi:hypothetical protein
MANPQRRDTERGREKNSPRLAPKANITHIHNTSLELRPSTTIKFYLRVPHRIIQHYPKMSEGVKTFDPLERYVRSRRPQEGAG